MFDIDSLLLVNLMRRPLLSERPLALCAKMTRLRFTNSKSVSEGAKIPEKEFPKAFPLVNL